MYEKRNPEKETAARDWIKIRLQKTSTAWLEKAVPAWWKSDQKQEGGQQHPFVEQYRDEMKKEFGFTFTDLEWKQIIIDHLKNSSGK